MAKHRKSPHEKYTHLDYSDEYKKRRLKQRLLIAAPVTALLASVVSVSAHALHSEPPAPITLPDCKLNDEPSIEYFKSKIDTIYENTMDDSGRNTVSTIYSSNGLLKVKTVGLSPIEKTASVPLARSVTDVLSYLPQTFIAASGVNTVHLEDISSDSASGQYDYTSPHAIILNQVILKDSVNPTVVNAPPHQYDRALIHDIAVHELGHAAVTRLCGTPIPPVEFSDTNKLPGLPNRYTLGNEDYGYVSDYATTNSSEDVAETVEAIMGTPSLSGAVGTLQHELEDNNPVLREKTAVVLAMLDKLETGAGDDALTILKMTRERSIR